MAKWIFTCNDNAGKYQSFTVTAQSKQEAILKAMIKAKKAAAGDITYNWSIRLKQVF